MSKFVLVLLILLYLAIAVFVSTVISKTCDIPDGESVFFLAILWPITCGVLLFVFVVIQIPMFLGEKAVSFVERRIDLKDEEKEFEVINADTGEIIKTVPVIDNKITISDLPTGRYIIQETKNKE